MGPNLEEALKIYYNLAASEMDPREYIPSQKDYLTQMRNLLKENQDHLRWIYDMLKRSDLVTEELEIECFCMTFANDNT